MHRKLLVGRFNLCLLCSAVLTIAMLSGSVFANDVLEAGQAGATDTGSGTITIGGNGGNDFTSDSGYIELAGDASFVTDGNNTNSIALGDYSSTSNGAGVFTGGNNISGITITANDVVATPGDGSANTDAGVLTIVGGTYNTSGANGAVSVTGAVATATAGISMTGTAADDITNAINTTNTITTTGGSVSMVVSDAGGDTASGSGKITLGGNISTTSAVAAGGDVTIRSASGDVDMTAAAVNTSSTGGAGGDIEISSNGNVDLGANLLTTEGSSGGAVSISGATVTANSGIYSRGSSGNGGDVTITTTSGGFIGTNGWISSRSGASGNGGNVEITSTTGPITLTGGAAESENNAIFTRAFNATVLPDNFSSGNVKLEITGTGVDSDITVGGIDTLGPSNGVNGGDVTITNNSIGDVIVNGNINAIGHTATGSDGGNVQITANGVINLGGNSIATAGTNGGTVTLSGSEITCNAINSFGDGGNAGDVTITGSSNIAVTAINTFNQGIGSGGAVNITSTTGSISSGAISAGSNGGTVGGNVAINGKISSIGNIDTQGTVSITTSELGGNISNIGGSVNTGQVDFTFNSISAGNRTVGTITTDNSNVSVTASSAAATGNLGLGVINAGTGNVTIDGSGMNTNLTLAGITGQDISVTTGSAGTATFGSAFTNSGAATINVTAGSTANFTGAVDMTAAGDKLVLDFGTDVATYARVTVGSLSVDNVTADGVLEDVYGTNGVSGETYAGVFSGAIGGANTDDTLNSNDSYRTYTFVNQTDIKVTTNSGGIISAIEGAGGSATDAGVILELVNDQSSFDAAGQTYVDQVLALSTPAQVAAARERRGEQSTTATAQVAIQGVMGSANAVGNQMTNFRSGNIAAGMASSFSAGGATAAVSDMADADTLADAYETGFTSASDVGVYKKFQVWANGFGGFGQQGTDGDMVGYDFWNIGTMVGLDYAFAKELRVGALFGYSYNKTDINWGNGDSTDNALRLGAYSSYHWDNFFVDLSPTMGIHMINSKRNLQAGSAVATSERTGFDFNINSTIGYTIDLPADINLTSSYRLGYTVFCDPSYTEKGAGVQNLSYSEFTSHSLVQDLGVKLGKLFRSSENLAFLPEVWGGWEIEYLNTGGTRNTTTNASVGSKSYGSSMNGMAANRAYWGAGVTALIKDNISVYGRYDHKIWYKGYNVGFAAGVKVSF